MADRFPGDGESMRREGMRRFLTRWEKTDRIREAPMAEARSESSRERRELAGKPVKTVAEWQKTFTEHLNHPEDTGDFKYVLSTFLMDTYPRDKEDPDYIASVDDLDFAVMLEADKHGGDEAVKKVKNRFVNWLTWKRPEEIKEMRDEARNLIFNVGDKKAHADGLGSSVIEKFLEKVEERPVLGMLAEKYKGQDPDVWQDQVAGSFLEYLKGYGEYEILKDMAAVVNQNIKKDKGSARADASSHIRNDTETMDARYHFQPAEEQAVPPQPENQEAINGPIELRFDQKALDRLTNGPNERGMTKENLRVRKAFAVFREACGKEDGFTKIILGLDGMKASAIIFRSPHYNEDFVLPMQYVRGVLGLYPLTGKEVQGSPDFSKGYIVGIKFKPDLPAPYIYAKTPSKVMEKIFQNIRLDGKSFNSRPVFGKMPYKYQEREESSV